MAQTILVRISCRKFREKRLLWFKETVVYVYAGMKGMYTYLLSNVDCDWAKQSRNVARWLFVCLQAETCLLLHIPKTDLPLLKRIQNGDWTNWCKLTRLHLMGSLSSGEGGGLFIYERFKRRSWLLQPLNDDSSMVVLTLQGEVNFSQSISCADWYVSIK